MIARIQYQAQKQCFIPWTMLTARGFTLVEVLISALIISAIALGFFTSLIVGRHLIKGSDNDYQATILADRRLVELQRLWQSNDASFPSDSIGNPAQPVETCSSGNPCSGINAGSIFTRNVYVIPDPDPITGEQNGFSRKIVRIDVTWNEQGNSGTWIPRTYQSVTLFYRP